MSNQNTDTRGNWIFYLIMGLVMVAWWAAGHYFWPTKPPPEREGEVSKAVAEKNKDALAAATAVGLAQPDGPPWNALGPLAAVVPAAKGERPGEKAPEKPAPQEPVDEEMLKVVTLGGPEAHLTVKLNPRGAGVLQAVLNHFQEADPKTGEPEWLDAEHKVKKPLELIPEDKNRDIASFLFYHYPDPTEKDYPLDTLGKRVWKRVEPAQVNPDEPVSEAVFQTEVQGVRVTKRYTLGPRDYHVGLRVTLELVDPQGKDRPFRYQLTGPHGLPVEGEWYASVFRNVMICRVDDKGYPDRDFQDLRTIANKGGGDEVTRGDESIRYAVVANQFFGAGVAVQTRTRGPDGNETEVADKNFLAQARPVLMQSAIKGTVRKSDGPDEVVVETSDRKRHTFEFASAEDRKRFEGPLSAPGDVIIVWRPAVEMSGKSRDVIVNVLDPNQTAAVFHDDVTVEVSTPKDDRILKVKADKPVVHDYALYMGPVKVRLLDDHLFGAAPAVDPATVAYYRDDLHLNTLTDYHSPGTLATWMAKTPWTAVVIWFTNRMHDILWFLYCVIQYVTPNVLVFGLCILLLTVMVRGAMHPVTRKQAQMSIKMQALQPELKKLKEKYGEDKQAMGMAQMELYRKHGINPMGSCWVMLLQMPVFLGLYYCLQESIHFRLAPFLWIKSLTAPDMLLHWGDKIPWISNWSDYGWFLWLGPYFNLLPLVAVGLMIAQQKLTMPPAADEQAEMQQKMMKYMMVFFGLMFYKVAAGLCLYFIASSLWGFAERRLLPKKKPGEPLPPPTAAARPTLMQKMMERLMEAQKQQTGRGNGATGPSAPPAAGGGKKKRGRPAPAPTAAGQDGFVARVRAWWAEVLRQAEKR